MDELFYQAVDLLRELIATPSVSRDERAASDKVEAYLKSKGVNVRRHGNNLWAIAEGYDDSYPTLLLNSHIDTVKPVAGWTQNPFVPTEKDGRLYGLGSNDAGASLVSLIAAFIYMNTRQRDYNLILAVSAEEEVSGCNGLESIIPMLPPVALALVGEPTGMNPAVAEKGLMVLDGIVTGVSGHAARNEGINAIYNALPVIDTLRTLQLPRISPLLGPVKISVTQIEAGTQHNVVPDSCRIVVDVRSTDCYTNEETLALIKQAVPGCTLTPRSTRLNPSGIDTSHALVQRFAMAGGIPYGSPTLSDQALMPWPSFKIGPGDSARSHTADEFIAIDEIRQALVLYIKALDGLKLS